ncbi:MAG: MFS transporter [Puniceicoccales bacterium]|jgi:ACS family hexuronate transporter-like MFS transporter|nr:MFS transporter [Puniceicoccales bacterium]
MQNDTSSPPNQLRSAIGNYRWTVCALVFFATTINYVDRQVLSLLEETLRPMLVLKPDNPVLQAWNATFGQISFLHWTVNPNSTGTMEYTWVVNAFQASYALGLLLVGRLVDHLGSKRGYGLALFGWSFAAIGHAFASGPFSFGSWRAALGITEAGNFPAAQKTVSEWFPKKERALATGIYNSGTNIGAIIAPIVVPWLAAHYLFGWKWSWQWAFVITGAIGLLWLVFWFSIYKSPREKLAAGKLSQAEFDYIHSDDEKPADSDAPAPKVSWSKLLSYRQTWAFFFGKFFTDPIWWFFLFWLPRFLSDENKTKIAAAQADGKLPEASVLAPALKELKDFTSLFGETPVLDKLHVDGLIFWPVAVAVVYTISTCGSIFGGWLPKHFIDSGMSAAKSRKTAMFIYALLPLVVLSAMTLGRINIWLAILVIGIGTAAHQAWSANIFTTVPDMFPKHAIGAVTGIGGMAGTLGSVIFQFIAGGLIAHYEKTNVSTAYTIIFVVCALAYLVAWVVMHAFAPRFEKVTDL